jgi:hypothetical protein
MCRLIDGVIKLNADDGCHPWLHRVERDGHANLTMLHAIIPRSEKTGMKRQYECPGCSNHMYNNNMINKWHV